MSFIKELIAHPLTKGLDIDDPQTTTLRRQIIQNKPFLYNIYAEWYQTIAKALPTNHNLTKAPVLELGSGAGFMSQFIPNLITSEILTCPNIDIVLDGMTLPFRAKSLQAIVMTDVLHHIPDVNHFFAEATRCIQPGGVIAMIEPWVTPWSTLIYTHLHHEPFLPKATTWQIPQDGGPLSGANGALPYLLFVRDRRQFEQTFPAWQIHAITPTMPFRYLISGGVSMRTLVPNFTYPLWTQLEKMLSPWRDQWAMFAAIILHHTPTS